MVSISLPRARRLRLPRPGLRRPSTGPGDRPPTTGQKVATPSWLADLATPPRIVSVFAGMGGADVSETTWEQMLDHGRGALEGRAFPPWAVFHEGRQL